MLKYVIKFWVKLVIKERIGFYRIFGIKWMREGNWRRNLIKLWIGSKRDKYKESILRKIGKLKGVVRTINGFMLIIWLEM